MIGLTIRVYRQLSTFQHISYKEITKMATTDTNAQDLETKPEVSPLASSLSAAAASPKAQQELLAMNLLDKTAQNLARKQAAADYPSLVDNNQMLLQYGNDVLAAFNKLVQDMKAKIKPLDIPEMNSLMDGLSKDMRQLKTKWDTSDPKVAKWVQDHVNGVKGFLGKSKSLIDLLMEDAMNLYQRIDKVRGTVGSREIDIVTNVGYLDKFYTANEAEVLALVVKIAQMEAVRDMALDEAGKMKVTGQPGDAASRRKAVVTEFAHNMDIKIGEFKNRLFLGWAQGPQITTKRTLNLSVAVRLNTLLNVTLPSVDFAIEQWKLTLEAQEAALIIQAVDNFSNDVQRTAAEAGAKMVVFIANVTNTPSLRPETIVAIAQSVEDQAKGLAEAYADGRKRQLDVDTAMLDGATKITNAQQTVSAAVLNAHIAKAKEAEAYVNTEAAKLDTLKASAAAA